MLISRTANWGWLVVLVIGLGYVFFTPPFQAPDETNHFLKAWSVSQGTFWISPTADHRLGDTMPTSLLTLCRLYRPDNQDDEINQQLTSIRQGLRMPLNPQDQSFVDFANTGTYAPVAYLPAALVICISAHLGCTPLVTFYLARLIHLGIWLWCLFVIWQIAGKSRWLFLYLGLLPGVFVFQTSLNPDTIVHAASWLLVLRLWVGAPGSRWQSAGPLLMLVSWQKLILFPLGWIKPYRSDFKLMQLWTILGLAVATFWALNASRTFIPYDHYHVEFRDSQTLNPGVDPSDQMQHIRKHPIDYCRVAITGVIRSAPATMAHILGKFGWEKRYLPTGVLALLLFGLVLICAQTPGPEKWVDRIQLAGICILVIGLFSVTNYLLWDPVGAKVQDNFQGRYFIPVLPLAGLAVSRPVIKGLFMRILAFGMLAVGHVSMIIMLLKSLYF